MPPLPIVISDTAGSPSTFPSLSELYVLLAKALGGYSYSPVSSTTIVSGEPGRWVIVDELKDDEDARARFAGGWLHVKNGAQAQAQRRIRTTGYEGPYGAVALTRVLTDNLAPEVLVEVTHPLPVRNVGTTQGLIAHVLEACKRIYIWSFIPLAGNGTQSYSLSAYSFLTRKEHTDGIYDTRGLSTTTPDRLSMADYNIVTNGASVTLTTALTYGTSETFNLKALVPASQVIYDSSLHIWGYTPAGPVNDTDQIAVDDRWVVTIGMASVLDYLISATRQDRTLSREEKDELLGDYIPRLDDRWGPAARELIQKVLPRKKPDSEGREIVAVTSGRGRRWP